MTYTLMISILKPDSRKPLVTGIDGIIYDPALFPEAGSIAEWGKAFFDDYVAKASLSPLAKFRPEVAGFIYYRKIHPSRIKMLSFYPVLDDADEFQNKPSEKKKEKILKLLNLSMSPNPHEAKRASEAAYRLMKENSITRDDLEEQNIIGFRIDFERRVSSVKTDLITVIAETSGCLSVFQKASKSTNAHALISGRERDVENAVYLYFVYLRIINEAAKELKKKEKWTQKEANSYKAGLVNGIHDRLKTNKDNFFKEAALNLYNVVPVDDRAEEVRKALFSSELVTGKAPTRKVYKEAFDKGVSDGKEIHINKATSHKSADTTLLSEQVQSSS